MGIKAQQYQTFYRHIRDKEDGQTVTWQVEDWENETAIWNRALRKAGLFHRPDGSYIYQGKKIQLDSLLFPERLSEYPAEIGPNYYTWENVIYIKVQYKQMGMYTIQKKMLGDFRTIQITELIKDMNGLDKKTAERIVHQYLLSLYQIRMVQLALPCAFVGWNLLKNTAEYRPAEILDRFNYPPLKSGRPLVKRDIECAFFSATIFSLLKAPLYRMKILSKDETEFALYLHSSQTVDYRNFEDYLDCLDHCADLFCNFRGWNDETLSSEFNGGKFRVVADEEFHPLSWWNHLCFPTIFADYPREQDVEDDIPYPDDIATADVKWSKKLFGNLSCLPILLLRHSALAKMAESPNILSLSWDSQQLEGYLDWFDRDERRVEAAHNQIMSSYLRFLNEINGVGYREFKKACKDAKEKANRMAGLNCANPTNSQRYCGSILCSLYVALDFSPEDIPFRISAKNAIHYLENHLLHFATATDFARFTMSCLNKKLDILFYQDADGIYLHYKQYWPAFQKYCKENRIILTVSAAHFRKNELSGYLKPQYNTCGSKYLRYDYRKKVDGREATVLNVSPSILRLIKA